jgi:hypothetical protein
VEEGGEKEEKEDEEKAGGKERKWRRRTGLGEEDVKMCMRVCVCVCVCGRVWSILVLINLLLRYESMRQ